jgi:HEPN domain-containing protein
LSEAWPWLEVAATHLSSARLLVDDAKSPWSPSCRTAGFLANRAARLALTGALVARAILRTRRFELPDLDLVELRSLIVDDAVTISSDDIDVLMLWNSAWTRSSHPERDRDKPASAVEAAERIVASLSRRGFPGD